MGGASDMTATGGVGGANSQGTNTELERCDQPFGTLTVDEDQTSNWWYTLINRYPKLGGTIPALRPMIQQSNCFVVVERGRSMNNLMQERALQESGELQTGSDFCKGQMVSADYTMSPRIHFSESGTSRAGGLVGRLLGGIFGGVVSGLNSNEASIPLLLIDNRSGVQISAAIGSAKNFDFGLFGGLFSGGLLPGIGGYADTPEGKILTAAFADSYNQMVKALRGYEAQQVEEGLGKGGSVTEDRFSKVVAKIQRPGVGCPALPCTAQRIAPVLQQSLK